MSCTSYLLLTSNKVNTRLLKLNTHNFKIFEEFLNISFVHMSESKRSTRFYSATLRFMMCPKYNVYFKGPAVFKGIIFWTLHYVLPTKSRGCRPWGLIVLVNPHSVHGHALSSGGILNNSQFKNITSWGLARSRPVQTLQSNICLQTDQFSFIPKIAHIRYNLRLFATERFEIWTNIILCTGLVVILPGLTM